MCFLLYNLEKVGSRNMIVWILGNLVAVWILLQIVRVGLGNSLVLDRFGLNWIWLSEGNRGFI